MKTTLTLLLFLITAASASAQVPMLRWDDPDTSGWGGQDVTFRQASDIDGDGVPEIVFAHRSQGASSAEIWVYSLATNQPLIVLPGSSTEIIFDPRQIFTTQDVTGDGLRDLLLMRSDDFGNGILELRSGLDGAVVWHADELVLGEAVSRPIEVMDLNFDGIADVFSVMIDSSNDTFHGAAFSGIDGAVLYWIYSAFEMNDPVSLGDLDGDGAGDYAVQSIFGSSFFIYSGATGTQIQTRSAAANANSARRSMVGVGDIDGDGVNDWAETWENLGFQGGSSIHFFTDILNPREIGAYYAERFDFTLRDTPILVHDFDGDGLNDIIFRTTHGNRASVILLSPVNGILREWSQPSPRLHALEEDWDGNGFPDLLMQSGLVTGETLVVASLENKITATPRQVSQASGGTVVFTVDVGGRFAGRRVQLFAGDGPRRPFRSYLFAIPGGASETVGFPFHPNRLTRRIFENRNNPGLADWTTMLDSQGIATLTIAFAPGEIPLTNINKQIHFTAVIDSATPPFPETSTERISINILP